MLSEYPDPQEFIKVRLRVMAPSRLQWLALNAFCQRKEKEGFYKPSDLSIDLILYDPTSRKITKIFGINGYGQEYERLGQNYERLHY